MVRTVVGVLALCALALGCGADDDDSGGRAGMGFPGGGGASGGGVSGVSGGGVSGVSGGGVSGMSGGASGSMSTVAGMSGSMAMAFVPGSPTWDAVYQEVLVDTGCSGGAYCHGGAGNLTGGLTFTDKAMAYQLLINVAASSKVLMGTTPSCMDSGKMRIVPGDPMNSLMYEKISSAMPSCGTLMPPTGMIPAEKIEQVRLWIMNGAKESG